MNQKLDISLPTELVEIINSRVQAGDYASASAVVEAAVQLLIDDEREHEAAMASVRNRIKASLEDPAPDVTAADMDDWIEGLASKYR